MRRRGARWLATALVVLAVPVLATGCGGSAGEEEGTPPATSEQVKGSDVIRVTLTAEAAKRVGVQTVEVRSDPSGEGRTVIPYEAVLYDPDGATWTYTSPQQNVFERADISVVRIDGGSAILGDGPAVGTPVVTVGATEIWGVEYGGIEED
jgi:hypothetical protein